ncbi:MAG: hypothetical protein J6X27_03395 [Bacteroidaceae bacterium]|nr:hypothetical protein [Bacteroidaceae bacterium]
MKKALLLLLILNWQWSIVNSQSSNDASLQRFAQFAGNMLTYNNNFTQEKVYLHLDNNGYIAGERLWFKAYVFKAASLLPTDMSKVLYVELLNPDGELMERKTLKVDNGRTYGDFELDPMLCHAGYYQVRAYTRAMLNWDDAYLFSRVFPIYAQPEDSVNFTGLTMPYHDYAQTKRATSRMAPEPVLEKTTQKGNDLLLTFYPEGGNITKGVPSRIAYKLTDRDGLPLYGELTICSADGKEIMKSTVLHDGMGVFSLPEQQDGAYVLANVEGCDLERFALPEARSEGTDIQVASTRENGLDITLRSSDAMVGRTLGLSVTCRGALLYFNTVVLEKEKQVNIPYDKLHDGIAQITLFTDQGEVLSERLAWVEPRDAAPQMTIRQNQDIYHPFEPVVLDIDLRDSEGQPLQADFSLAVRDAATEIAPPAASLMAEMLLASDLKGYIANPDYYFEADDPAHRQALDLLLMVQGWRRYSWQEMSGVEPFVLKQPCEEGLTLIGSLTPTRTANKNLAREGSLDINFLMQTINGTKMFDIPTDSTGYFAVQLPDFNGDATSIMTVTNRKDKRVYTDFVLNRNFSPTPKPYEPLQLEPATTILDTRTEALTREADTFEWKDTIPDYVSRIIQLGEVKITGRRTLGYHPGARFSWLGGADATKDGAACFYNLHDELDTYLDQGNSVPYLRDWLMERNPLFYYDLYTGEMWYRGKNVIVVVDNNLHNALLSSDMSTYFMNQYKWLSIVENEAVANRVALQAFEKPGALTPSPYVVFFLYSDPELNIPNEYKRGTRWINLHGYSLCTDFYSPDYRQHDIPTPTDHRRTLYWNPSLVTDTDGKAQIIFYSGSRPDERLLINAQGIAVNGQIIGYGK